MHKWSIRSIGIVAVALVGLGLASLPGQAEPVGKAATYNFKDPKGVNAISFFMDSQLEPIFGMATGISGEVTFDPANPAATTGALHIDAATLHCSNATMTKFLHKADWINVKENKTITYTIDKVAATEVEESGRVVLKTTGHLLVAGVKVPKELTITADSMKDGAKARGGAKSGDLLVLRTQFSISRTDFGLKPDMGFEHVGRSIQIIAAIAGYSQ